MKKKIEKDLTPAELAEHLEQIAGQLREGAFEVSGRQWSVPGRIEAQIKHKEKKGRFSGKIKFRWSSLADYNAAARDEVEKWEESFKSLKKRMGSQFKTMQKDVDQGRIPPKKTLMEFVRDSLQMDRSAEPEWRELMAEYLDHLENLQRAAENHQLETVRHELRDLSNRMKQCHREFK